MYTSASCEKSVSYLDVSHSFLLNHFMLHESQDCGVLLIIIGFFLLRRFHCSLFRPRKEACLSVCCVPRGWRPQRNANRHMYRHVLYELMKRACITFVLLVTMSLYFIYHSHKSGNAWNVWTWLLFSTISIFRRYRFEWNCRHFIQFK
jgi:hypothetical protein